MAPAQNFFGTKSGPPALEQDSCSQAAGRAPLLDEEQERTLADHFHPEHPFYAPSHPLSVLAIHTYTRRGSDTHPDDSRVKLHVYKFRGPLASINEAIAFGFYHVSVEVYGLDFHYGFCDDGLTGVLVRAVHEDPLPRAYVPYWTVNLGRVGLVPIEENRAPLNFRGSGVESSTRRVAVDEENVVPVGMRRITLPDVALLARRFLRAYPAAAYHPTERNCWTFVEEFLGRLRMGGVHGEFGVPSPHRRSLLVRETTKRGPESSQSAARAAFPGGAEAPVANGSQREGLSDSHSTTEMGRGAAYTSWEIPSMEDQELVRARLAADIDGPKTSKGRGERGGGVFETLTSSCGTRMSSASSISPVTAVGKRIFGRKFLLDRRQARAETKESLLGKLHSFCHGEMCLVIWEEFPDNSSPVEVAEKNIPEEPAPGRCQSPPSSASDLVEQQQPSTGRLLACGLAGRGRDKTMYGGAYSPDTRRRTSTPEQDSSRTSRKVRPPVKKASRFRLSRPEQWLRTRTAARRTSPEREANPAASPEEEEQPVSLVSNNLVPEWMDARRNKVTLFLIGLWSPLARSSISTTTNCSSGGTSSRATSASSGLMQEQDDETDRLVHFFTRRTVMEVCSIAGEDGALPRMAAAPPELASATRGATVAAQYQQARKMGKMQSLLKEDEISRHKGQWWYMI